MDDPRDLGSHWAGPAGPSGPDRGSGLAVGRAVVLTVVAVVLGAVLLAVGTRPPVRSSAAPALSHPSTTTTVPVPTTTTTTVPRSTVRVLVANGTTKANVAAHFSMVLQTQGWNTQAPADTTTPAASSSVYYGPNQQVSAGTIAAELKIPSSAVSPLTTSVPVRGDSGMDVVVVIGTDLAGNGFPAVTPTSSAAS